MYNPSEIPKFPAPGSREPAPDNQPPVNAERAKLRVVKRAERIVAVNQRLMWLERNEHLIESTYPMLLSQVAMPHLPLDPRLLDLGERTILDVSLDLVGGLKTVLHLPQHQLSQEERSAQDEINNR